MENYAISVEWYNEIKDRVTTADPYFYFESDGREYVEVFVNVEEFEQVSRELGWMY